MLDALARETVRSRSTMTRAVLAKSASRFGRPLLIAMLLGAGLIVVGAPGCQSEGIGDPCTPEQEYDPTFLGFDEKEVNVESKSFQCRTRLCLVHHFRGRVSCQYGQGPGGESPSGVKSPCRIPGNTESKIEGAKEGEAFIDDKKKSSVPSQCVDRAADK